jgi:mono/diheme cytochrome c family protein
MNRASCRKTGNAARLITCIAILLVIAALPGCSRKLATSSPLKPAAYGAAVVESSGGKQTTGVGTQLPQPVVVQVNDEQGTAVTGALVVLHGPNGVFLDPAAGLTDSSGQFTSNVSLGTIPGRYQLTASTMTKAGKNVELKIEEIGLGYQEMLGSQLNDQYCARCHNQESSPERVSNYDNLETKPHPFTEGDTLNKMSDADLVAIISHGGPALNKSPLMAPYGYTLSKSEIQALIAYIRMVSDPPYGAPGIVYAQK